MIISPALRFRPCLLWRLDESDGSSLGLSRTPFLISNKKPYSKFLWKWAVPSVFPGTKRGQVGGRTAAALALSVSQAVHSDTTRTANQVLDYSSAALSRGLGSTGSVWIGEEEATTASSNGSCTVALTVFSTQEGASLNSPENHVPISVPEHGAYSHSENNSMLAKDDSVPVSSQTSALESSISEEDAFLIKAEKLRRKKISEANKGKAPWNKGRTFPQGVLQSARNEPAVPTIEHTNDMDETTSILVREKWRRLRISQANKGKVPWNKGRLHSEETKQRIKARTTEAMKDPKIRAKLRTYGVLQSPETKVKIRSALLRMWNAKRKIKASQEICVKEWKYMIAEMARCGNDGDVEYQWDSYATIMKELREAWRIAYNEERRKARQRKNATIIRTSEHRMKIAEAIRAKWADPGYRVNVQQGIHASMRKRGVQPTQRKVRQPYKKTMNSTTPQKRRPAKQVSKDGIDKSEDSIKTKSEKKSVTSDSPSIKTLPVYQNPLTQERLEKLKQMRASRLSEQRRRTEVTERARVLLAEANRAARALEAAAVKDKNALASLLETRRLLAEAARSFESAGLGRYGSLGLLVEKGSEELWRVETPSKRRVIDPMKPQHEVSSTTAACYGCPTAIVSTSWQHNVWRTSQRMPFIDIISMVRLSNRCV